MHVQTYVVDFPSSLNYDNLSIDAINTNYPSRNQHIHFTQIISTYKGKYFKDLPTIEKLKGKNGKEIIGLKYWPTMAFDILKRYASGRVTDYKLQHCMMDFDGSTISISETTGKIEDEK